MQGGGARLLLFLLPTAQQKDYNGDYSNIGGNVGSSITGDYGGNIVENNEDTKFNGPSGSECTIIQSNLSYLPWD